MRPITIIILLTPILLWSQQDAKIAFYQQNLQLYNPATTGLEDRTTINSSLRNQWIGVEGAPSIRAFSFSIPGGEKRLAYGGLVLVDQTFVERQTRLFATFSYRIPIDNSNSLYLGIQGGGNLINLNFSGLNVAHNDDGELGNFTRFYPNIGVGAHLKMNRFYLSLSTPMLFGNKKEKNADAIAPTPADDMHFYFSTGVRLPAFSEYWEYVAYTLVRWVPRAPTSLVLNAGLAYQKSEVLLAYYPEGGLGASALFDNGGFISVGYAYQFPSSNLLSKLHSGNHELIFRIRLGNKKEDKMDVEVIEQKFEEVAIK